MLANCYNKVEISKNSWDDISSFLKKSGKGDYVMILYEGKKVGEVLFRLLRFWWMFSLVYLISLS